MNDHARKLLATISEEGADAILRQLRDGARTEAELRTATSLSHRAAHERLAALRDLGVIRPATGETKGPGRPPRAWSLTDHRAVTRFSMQAEALERALMKKKLWRSVGDGSPV
jgi:DNA-binding HxlR family transcriptional regulator